jgi:hypothetical protein
MPSAADPDFIQAVERLLERVDHPVKTTPWRLEPIHNAFQEKNNIFKIQPDSGPALVLKLEHNRFDAQLEREAHTLAFLAGTDIPAPKLYDFGALEGFTPNERRVRGLLMEFVEGVPLNWRYYRADRSQRRYYLEQVVDLVKRLSQLQVDPAAHLAPYGGIAGPVEQTAAGIRCEKLSGYQPELPGPFENQAAMYALLIPHGLERLSVQDPDSTDRLSLIWQRLDASVLAEQPGVVLAHADIAPMNIIVDPETHIIQALIDWEFAGFYPRDQDFHSLLYYDRHQDWKWCGPKDVALARDLLQDRGLGPPDGYDARLPWYDLLQLIQDQLNYRDWFAADSAERADYEAALARRLDAFWQPVMGRGSLPLR